MKSIANQLTIKPPVANYHSMYVPKIIVVDNSKVTAIFAIFLAHPVYMLPAIYAIVSYCLWCIDGKSVTECWQAFTGAIQVNF